MPAFRRGKLEPFAQAIAEGLPPGAASERAAYAKTRGCVGRSERADILARVSEIHSATTKAAEDLAPIITRLMAAAGRAEALNSAAGYVAMRGLLAEAVRLTTMIGAKTPGPMAALDLPRPLTTEEWLAEFGPQTVSEP